MLKDMSRNKELRNFDIDILVSSHALIDKEWHYENITSPFSRLYYVKKGTGKIVCNGKTTELRPGNVYLIPLETTVSLMCDDGEIIEKLYFHFLLSSVEKYDLLLDIPKAVYEISLAEAEAEGIFEIFDADNYGSLLKLKMLLYQTIDAICEKCGLKLAPIKQYSETVRKTMDYIQNNLRVNLSLKDISDGLFMSESKICKEFKKETGMSVGQYTDELVFTRVKQLLMQKKYSFKEISVKLGFCDQFYFSRRFKEKFGKTPSQYRREVIRSMS